MVSVEVSSLGLPASGRLRWILTLLERLGVRGLQSGVWLIRKMFAYGLGILLEFSS